MSNHIKTAVWTILVPVVLLLMIVSLDKQLSSWEKARRFPNVGKNHRNVLFGEAMHYSNTVEENTYGSYKMNIDEKNMMNISVKNNSWTNVSGEIPNELRRLRPMILDDFPSKFLPSYKNPCYIRYPEQRLHCLPYFFLLGVQKCGTTDIWSKIIQHPEIVADAKEPHFWERYSYPDVPLRVYEEKFMTKTIERLTKANITKKQVLVTGDGSASTFWDNTHWLSIYPEYKTAGPPYVIADVIHTVLPDAKLLVSFRDPTERAYSDYLYFNPVGSTSPEEFHEIVVKCINEFSTCLTKRSLGACSYGKDHPKVRLKIGIYPLYLRDWLKLYPRDQLMVLKLEEWHSHCPELLQDIFEFLEVAPLSPTHIAGICKKTSVNVMGKDKRIAKMLNSTRKLLRDFYRPYVVEFASILNDDKFLWDYNDI